MPSETPSLEPAFRLAAAKAAMQAAVQTVAVAYGLNLAEAEMILGSVLSEMRGDLIKHMALKHIDAVTPQEEPEQGA